MIYIISFIIKKNLLLLLQVPLFINYILEGKKSQVKDEVPKFSRVKFLKWIELLGTIMYSGHKKTLPLILKDIFQENKKKQEFKVMVYDEINKRILSE